MYAAIALQFIVNA